MGLYKPNGVPWEGKSAVIPLIAIDDMWKMNHHWNWLPLEDIERTCKNLAKKEPGLMFKCSECGFVISCGLYYTGEECHCPKCGAKVIDGN